MHREDYVGEFFFFQAEDGIRDLTVTGVQTCALPIFIIDFIDMRDEPHRRAVLSALERALSGDRAQTHIGSPSPPGVVEMTRHRPRETLRHLLSQPRPTCVGRGVIPTPDTECTELFRETVRRSGQI